MKWLNAEAKILNTFLQLPVASSDPRKEEKLGESASFFFFFPSSPFPFFSSGLSATRMSPTIGKKKDIKLRNTGKEQRHVAFYCIKRKSIIIINQHFEQDYTRGRCSTDAPHNIGLESASQRTLHH